MKHCYIYYDRPKNTVEFDSTPIACDPDRQSARKAAFARASSHYYETGEEVIIWYHTFSGGYKVIASFGNVFPGDKLERFYGIHIFQ